jgi:acetyltransferase-like isoleucine patch superfamily enzyme
VSIVSKSSRGNASSLYTISRIRTYTPTAKIYIGSNTGMNGVSITSRTKSIYIGSNCRIAPNTVIVDSDYHSMIPPESRLQNPGFEFDKDVVINENVWIGMRSIILKGVTIGKNSVIAAGSVVVKDIPEDCLAAGVPAIVVKKL